MTRYYDDVTEDEPLLGEEERGHEEESEGLGFAEAPGYASQSTQGQPAPENPPRRRFWSRITLSSIQTDSPFKIVLIISFLKFAISTSGMVIMVPLFRLIEDSFCHQYYHKDPSEQIDELLCKVDDVQRKLAYMGGWGALISSVVSLIVAFPYGMLADRIGRKPTLIISYIGIMMAFSWSPMILWFWKEPNLYLLLLGSLFFLIGGGITVAFNTMYAMAADVSEEKDRSSSFVYLSFGAVTGGLIGPILAGGLMEAFGPWVPIGLVLGITPIIFITLLFLPETLRVKLDGVPKEQLPFIQAAREHIRSGLRDLAESFIIVKNGNILLCLLPFIIQNPLFVAYSTTLTLYVSKYFGWKLAETSFLLSPLGFLHLAVLLALPWLSSALVNPTGRFQYSGFMKDMVLTRISIVFLILGAAMEGFSQEIVLFLVGLVFGTLGSAASPLGRAIITQFVEPEQTSRLYALLSMVETAGSFFGGPVLAWCFSIGMQKKGIFRGLPWFYVMILCSLALGALMFVREPKKKPPVTTENSNGEEGLDYQSAGEEP